MPGLTPALRDLPICPAHHAVSAMAESQAVDTADDERPGDPFRREGFDALHDTGRPGRHHIDALARPTLDSARTGLRLAF
jgi:hypothetical protein